MIWWCFSEFSCWKASERLPNMIPLLLPYSSIVECYTTGDSLACGTNDGNAGRTQKQSCAKAKRPKTKLQPVDTSGCFRFTKVCYKMPCVRCSAVNAMAVSDLIPLPARLPSVPPGPVWELSATPKSYTKPIRNVRRSPTVLAAHDMLSKSQWRSKRLWRRE